MNLQILNKETIEYIFHHHIVHDFPPEETRPLKNMLKLMDQNYYKGYGLYDENELLGYAFLAGDINHHVILLDYLAIVESKRSLGYGSELIKLLKQELYGKCLVVEVESIESAKSEDEIKIRERRIQFYLNNSFIKSSLSCNLFHVDYSLLYVSNEKQNDDILYDEIVKLYKSIFNPIFYKIFVKMKKGT